MPADADAPRLLPSVMDRLYDPGSMGGKTAGYDQRRMAERVRADLEDLLNARLTVPDMPPGFPETAGSILTYGMPDLTGYDTGVDGSRADLARVVQAVVARFEPRLRKVRVVVDRQLDKGGLAVKFRIEAELNVDPAPEIGFETVVELTTGHARVAQPKDGR